MEPSGRSYAWEVEPSGRQIALDDEGPSASGRSPPDEQGPADRSLRSVAHLPRSSRNGNEASSSQPAAGGMSDMELAVPPSEGFGDRSSTGRLERTTTGASFTARRTRRGSIAEFFSLRPGSMSRDLSAAPSREVTLHGMGAAAQPAGRRMRRGSVMQALGFGNPAVDTEPQVSLAPDLQQPPPLATRSKSMGNTSQGRRRRASMLDLFRSSQTFDAAEVAALETQPSGAPGAPPKSSSKSRRGSVMGFFRSSHTGLATPLETVGSTSMGRTTRGLRGDGVMSGRSQRRRSVIDILGHSSKKVFAKLMNQEFEDPEDQDDDIDEGRLWFTSLADFKPLTFKYLTGRYSSAFFACSVKTGEHYILKQFEKGKMSLADERGVRRALAFAQMLEHEHIVQCCGTWEDEDALYIVEEYATRGDLLQDSMSHPEKYTEAFMATKVVKPLLEVLVYLHASNVIHRAIFPEYVMFGREDRLKLGHFTSAVDQRLDPPTERIHFLDYMAPEMLSVRTDDPSMGPPWGNAAGRPKVLSSHQTRVTRMQTPSNDGSSGQLLPRPGGAGFPPHSPIPASAGVYGPRSPLISPAGTRRMLSTGTDLPGLAGFPGNPDSEPPDKSPPSRAGSRSPLNIFRSARRMSPQQLPEDESSGCGGGGGRGRTRGAESMAGVTPWRHQGDSGGQWSISGSPSGGGFPTGPPRRRKSVVEEMSAPWLRPLGPEPDTDTDGDRAGGGCGCGRDERSEGGGVTAAAADASSPAAAPPQTNWTCAGGGGASGASADAGVRESSLLPVSPQTSCAVVALGDSSGQVNFSDSCEGEQLPPRLAPDAEPSSLARSTSRASRASASGPDPALAAGSARPTSSRRSGSALGNPQPTASGPSSTSTRPGSALGPPVPTASLRPGSSRGRASCASLYGSGGDSSERRAPPSPQDRDECLPGYAADPPARQPSTLRRQQSSLRPQTSGLRQQQSGLLGPELGGALGVTGVTGSAGPGPVMESLVLEPTPPTPSSPTDTGDVPDVKRARAGVSFTAVMPASPTMTGAGAGAGADDSAAALTGDERSSRGGVRSRVASREASGILGLRTMARNLTTKLGQVLGGHGGRGVEGSLGPAGEPSSIDVAEGGGPDVTPRQSMAGGGGGGLGGGGGIMGLDATTIFVPTNPWEWQDHYNEKVDLWQVGCLVHEILCLSLPFEAEDKLLACALILWADIVSFPDHLSPECHDFMRACLTKNPAERPSASELLQHPWISRHVAGEVLKSVRQQKEEETAVHGVSPGGQPVTPLQRAATALGLGWLAGTGRAAPAGDARAGAAGNGSWWSWWPRPWGSKVAPAGAGAGGGAGAGARAGGAKGRTEAGGDAAFEMAVAMVHEQQQQHRLEEGGAAARRRSLDVETGAKRASLEVLRQQHQQQLEASSTAAGGGVGGGVGGGGGGPGQGRWARVL